MWFFDQALVDIQECCYSWLVTERARGGGGSRESHVSIVAVEDCKSRRSLQILNVAIVPNRVLQLEKEPPSPSYFHPPSPGTKGEAKARADHKIES